MHMRILKSLLGLSDYPNQTIPFIRRRDLELQHLQLSLRSKTGDTKDEALRAEALFYYHILPALAVLSTEILSVDI